MDNITNTIKYRPRKNGRCESSHFVCYISFRQKRTVGLLVVREGVKGKEKFIMEYYENDWDMLLGYR